MEKYRVEKQTGKINGNFMWKVFEFDPQAGAYIYIGTGIGNSRDVAIQDVINTEEDPLFKD